MSIHAVVGGSFGSEGKGLYVGHVARGYGLHVRVGAANAGHTVYTREEKGSGSVQQLRQDKHVTQQIPIGAYSAPHSVCALGPGAQISPDILFREMEVNARWRALYGYDQLDLRIDPRAHVITDDHVEAEQLSGLDERIGSTSTLAREGIGTAQAARVMREAECVLADDWARAIDGLLLQDVPKLIAEFDDAAEGVLLEGTQGTGLSLTTGMFPYVTSRNTTAAGLAADCGVAPGRIKDVTMVVRSYPIRVAGTSGPFFRDSEEIAWEDIGIDPENERTTVTKKVRRVATLSLDQVAEAACLNGPTAVALTFADYVDPEIAGKSGWMTPTFLKDFHPKVWDMITNVQYAADAPVTVLGTGPHSLIEIQR